MDNANIQFPLKKRTSMKQTQITCGYTQVQLMEVRFCFVLFCFVFFTILYSYLSVQFISVAQSCPTLCNPMDCSTPGFHVHHQLQEFTQTHVHWVGDAIQPPHPLLFLSPPSFNLSQHQGLPMNQFFTSPSQNTGVSASASVLPMNIHDWFSLGWTSLNSL